ncbi:hypothetical protein Vsou_20950 [Vulcanisaeta souniana JCM 11219]|uniref:Peptidase M48 domain-containing protein n=1 Tax=Vulcanisaeta souniana JCM 11219 TaxID=1293586 RepID=A0ABN6ST20_9CREN|nr:M48 family metallopeptidase [Vulcanisaeta souniana]BDR93002.1 hypothetical protein Vsou_20950 [Vulcanisaeta souniana JCM 11219]
MAAIRIYQIIRDLIKDPQSLINYIESYLLSVIGIPYIEREINNDVTRLIVSNEHGNAELSINHEIRIKGHDKVKVLLNALVLRYLGTNGARKITVLLLRRGNRVYRVNDLPRMRSLPVGLIGLVILLIMIISIVITILRIMNVILSMHIIILMLLSPLIIPIIYSYILQLKIRWGNLRNSEIIKITLEYGEFDEQRFNEALRFLSRIENIKSLTEIRRFIMTLVNNPGTKPQAYNEEVISISSILDKLGVKKYGIYLINMDQCNAASIGLPGINYVILTSRLVSCLNSDELTAVIMHEVGHIVHGDSAKALFLISLSQLVNIALITYIIPLMSLPAIPILIGALFMELFMILLTMRFSEYSADKYAMKFIPGKDLAMALIKVTWKELHQELASKRSRVLSSHPSVSGRLIRIASIK